MTSRRSGRPAVRPGADALAALRLVTETLADRKAIDPLVLDLRGLTGAADYFVIVSGTSDEIGRASCRERVEVSVGGVSFEKKKERIGRMRRENIMTRWAV